MSYRNSTIEAAAQRVPSSLSSLRVLSTDVVHQCVVLRSLGCNCGAGTGTVKATPSDEGYLDPIAFECLVCGTEVVFFDSKRDGYDARLNDFTAYTQGEAPIRIACDKCSGVEMQVSFGLIYNIDFEEEGDLDLAQAPEDCFDACDINAECSRCGSAVPIGDWELA